MTQDTMPHCWSASSGTGSVFYHRDFPWMSRALPRLPEQPAPLHHIDLFTVFLLLSPPISLRAGPVLPIFIFPNRGPDLKQALINVCWMNACTYAWIWKSSFSRGADRSCMTPGHRVSKTHLTLGLIWKELILQKLTIWGLSAFWSFAISNILSLQPGSQPPGDYLLFPRNQHPVPNYF